MWRACSRSSSQRRRGSTATSDARLHGYSHNRGEAQRLQVERGSLAASKGSRVAVSLTRRREQADQKTREAPNRSAVRTHTRACGRRAGADDLASHSTCPSLFARGTRVGHGCHACNGCNKLRPQSPSGRGDARSRGGHTRHARPMCGLRQRAITPVAVRATKVDVHWRRLTCSSARRHRPPGRLEHGLECPSCILARATQTLGARAAACAGSLDDHGAGQHS